MTQQARKNNDEALELQNDLNDTGFWTKGQLTAYYERFDGRGGPPTVLRRFMNLLQADQSIDCTGLPGALSTARVRAAIDKLVPGQVLAFKASGGSVVTDVLEWVETDRHELLRSQQCRDGAFRFLVRKSSL